MSVASVFLLMFLVVHVNPSLAHSRKLMKSTPKSSFTLREVKSYLQAYGYMVITHVDDPNDAVGDDSINVSSLEPGIRTFQEWNRMEVTGKLDSETLARMMTPRCGVPDIVQKKAKGEHDSSRQAGNDVKVAIDYAIIPNMNPWTKRQLTYKFITSTISSVPMNDLRAICTRAFARWADVSPFQFQEVGYSEAADIRIGFYVGDHYDMHPFDGPGNVLAHSFPPQDGRLHFDGSEYWSKSTPSYFQTDLESVTVHEIGHILGLAHSQDETAVMYYAIAPGAVKRELQQDDIDGIHAIYPSN